MEIKTVREISPGKCTGCAACMNVCPENAIEMKPDCEGFLRPEISWQKCRGCARCVKTCPVSGAAGNVETGDSPFCYAAWSKDREIRFQSTSGGVFTHLAREILRQGGAVIGARYRADQLVEHTMIREEKGIAFLRQSKYVQSRAGFIYREAGEMLKKGIPVLFTGTPCQCAGLAAFLGQAYESLYLCDFICRGVNSPLVHQKYIESVERTIGGTVQGINHRSKRVGWSDFRFSVSDGSCVYDLGNSKSNPFLRGFLTNLFLRPSCYHCRFKGNARPTDLTLGDCWGYPKKEDGGVSLVMVHSPKGQRLWASASKELDWETYSIERAAGKNPSLLSSAIDTRGGRSVFFSEFLKGRGVED